MPIAAVDQNLVNSYLDRVQRFVNGVNAFKERIDAMMEGRLSDLGPSQSSYIPTESTVPIESTYSQPSYAEPSYSPSAYTEPEVQQAAAAPVTADDVDLDALLSGISLDSIQY